MTTVRILFDTNVVLDLLLDRAPFSSTASALVTAVAEGRLDGLLCTTTVTTIHYLAQRVVGPEQARRHVGTLLHLFEIAPVNRSVLATALHLGFSDFEDAVLHAAATQSRADGIVTRNSRDFAKASLPVFTPEALHRVLEDR